MMKKTSGFTLIEMLIVIALFGILAVTASNSLFSILRAGTNTEIVKEIKQNGDYALSVLEANIRNASDISAVTPCTGVARDDLVIINPDSTQTRLFCSNGRLMSSPILQDEDNFLTSEKVTVIDNANCSTVFTCTTPPTGPKNVLISFTLIQANVSANAAEKSKQTFSARFSLRNR